MADFKSEESAFNMAISYLMRIDRILTACWYAASKNDITDWQRNLRGLYRELSVKLKDDEDKDIVGDYNDKPLDLNHLTSKDATFRNVAILMNNAQTRKTQRRVIMFLLEQLEVKMRRKLQEKGMLLPSKSDPRYAVLER